MAAILRYKSAAFVMAVVLASSVGSCRGGGTACSNASECADSDESKSLGRCGPREFACLNAECRAACPPLCRMIQDDQNPCADPARICSESEQLAASLLYGSADSVHG